MPPPSTSVKPPWTRPPGARSAALSGAVAFLVLCVVGATLGRTQPARAAATPATSAMNGWSLHGLSASDLNAQLNLMESEGVRLLRVDASWSAIQPQAPTAAGPGYRWGAEDAEVAALAAHHIQWLPIVDYSAPWAATHPGDWRSPPANDAQFAAFAAAIAARYGPGGTFWLQNPQLPFEPVSAFEIWNEENGDYFWDTGPNPAGYARLYLAARSAIHSVNPAAQVMIGGLTNPRLGIGALAFIAAMFQQDPALYGNVDALGLHPYAPTPQGVVNNVAQARTLLDSLGQDATTLDVTEFGWEVGATSAAEQQRAEMMSAVAQELENSNCGIGLIAVYDWMDPSYITGGDWGVAGAGGLRPAGVSWFAGLAAAARAPQTTPCQLAGATAPAAALAAPAIAALSNAAATATTPPSAAAPIRQASSATPPRAAAVLRPATRAHRHRGVRRQRTGRRRAHVRSRSSMARRGRSRLAAAAARAGRAGGPLR
jgi:hypothetical protein